MQSDLPRKIMIVAVNLGRGVNFAFIMYDDDALSCGAA